MKKDEVRNYCNTCKRITNHDVEGEHSYLSENEYNQFKRAHLVVKCRGCDCVSFRKEYHDYENAFHDQDGEWDYELEIELYPKKKMGGVVTHSFPTLVREIYTETCAAYSENSLILAGIGLRATIEAICNDQNISGKDLSTRINNLSTKGLISKKDSTRLHSIRFLGNDAAHEITRPSESALEAALIIVEHLLTTVYILDSTFKGHLIPVIEECSQLEELLVEKLKNFEVGDEFPLVHFLGKDSRRLTGSSAALEKNLAERIGKNEFCRLSFGKREKLKNSQAELQHYVVCAEP